MTAASNSYLSRLPLAKVDVLLHTKEPSIWVACTAGDLDAIQLRASKWQSSGLTMARKGLLFAAAFFLMLSVVMSVGAFFGKIPFNGVFILVTGLTFIALGCGWFSAKIAAQQKLAHRLSQSVSHLCESSVERLAQVSRFLSMSPSASQYYTLVQDSGRGLRSLDASLLQSLYDADMAAGTTESSTKSV